MHFRRSNIQGTVGSNIYCIKHRGTWYPRIVCYTSDYWDGDPAVHTGESQDRGGDENMNRRNSATLLGA